MKLNYHNILRYAIKQKEHFRLAITNISYERKGILFSEMFFLYICTKQSVCNRILESGRARAQSAEVLATIFPTKEIISIEYDSDSPDIQIAEKRLRSYSNVDARFGDARKILPTIASQNDIALIDGPKEFRGIRLALQLLISKKLSLVFIHDTRTGTPERDFLEKYLPQTVYSDNPEFSSRMHDLDDGKVMIAPEYTTHANYPEAGYGFSLACLEYNSKINYRKLYMFAVLTEIYNKMLSIFKFDTTYKNN